MIAILLLTLSFLGHHHHWRRWCYHHKQCSSHHWKALWPRQSRRWHRGHWEQDWITCYLPSGYAADGTPVVQGVISATTPFGTKYWIPGLHYRGVVHDRGGDVGPGHLDIALNGCSDSGFPTGFYRVRRFK